MRRSYHNQWWQKSLQAKANDRQQKWIRQLTDITYRSAFLICFLLLADRAEANTVNCTFGDRVRCVTDGVMNRAWLVGMGAAFSTAVSPTISILLMLLPFVTAQIPRFILPSRTKPALCLARVPLASDAPYVYFLDRGETAFFFPYEAVSRVHFSNDFKVMSHRGKPIRFHSEIQSHPENFETNRRTPLSTDDFIFDHTYLRTENTEYSWVDIDGNQRYTDCLARDIFSGNPTLMGFGCTPSSVSESKCASIFTDREKCVYTSGGKLFKCCGCVKRLPDGSHEYNADSWGADRYTWAVAINYGRLADVRGTDPDTLGKTLTALDLGAPFPKFSNISHHPHEWDFREIAEQTIRSGYGLNSPDPRQWSLPPCSIQDGDAKKIEVRDVAILGRFWSETLEFSDGTGIYSAVLSALSGMLQTTNEIDRCAAAMNATVLDCNADCAQSYIRIQRRFVVSRSTATEIVQGPVVFVGSVATASKSSFSCFGDTPPDNVCKDGNTCTCQQFRSTVPDDASQYYDAKPPSTIVAASSIGKLDSCNDAARNYFDIYQWFASKHLSFVAAVTLTSWHGNFLNTYQAPKYNLTLVRYGSDWKIIPTAITNHINTYGQALTKDPKTGEVCLDTYHWYMTAKSLEMYGVVVQTDDLLPGIDPSKLHDSVYREIHFEKSADNLCGSIELRVKPIQWCGSGAVLYELETPRACNLSVMYHDDEYLYEIASNLICLPTGSYNGISFGRPGTPPLDFNLDKSAIKIKANFFTVVENLFNLLVSLGQQLVPGSFPDALRLCVDIVAVISLWAAIHTANFGTGLASAIWFRIRLDSFWQMV